MLRTGQGAAYILEMIFLTFIFVSGLVNGAILLRRSPKKVGRQKYMALMAVKLLLLVFLTPVTDLIALSISGAKELSNY